MIEQAAKKQKKHLHEHLTWKVILIISIVLAIGFSLGLAFDYQVSDVMYNKTHKMASLIPHILYAYMLVLFVVLAFGVCWTFAISSYAYKHDKLWVPILGTIFAWVCMFTFAFYIYYEMTPFIEYYGKKAGTIHNITILAVIFLGSFIFAMCLFSEKFNKEMCNRTFTYLVEVVIMFIALAVLKMFWSRPSPINAFTPNEHFYEPWWNIRPFYCFRTTTQNLMFWTTPAGYGTQSAVIIFATTSTLELTQKFDKRKLHTFFFYAAWSYAIILSILRLLAGESYLTDVCLTLICGLWISYGSKALAYKFRKKIYGQQK